MISTFLNWLHSASWASGWESERESGFPNSQTGVTPVVLKCHHLKYSYIERVAPDLRGFGFMFQLRRDHFFWKKDIHAFVFFPLEAIVLPCSKNSWPLLCRPSHCLYKGSNASSCYNFLAPPVCNPLSIPRTTHQRFSSCTSLSVSRSSCCLARWQHNRLLTNQQLSKFVIP